MENYLTFDTLKGKILKSVNNIDNEELIFETFDNETYVLRHDQDCCESVFIEDICGNLNDLIGYPILLAEKIIYDDENPKGVPIKEIYDNSFTWTFYKLSTIKGSVTIRWYGDSNGYYSESVDFVQR
jgi:hypothetical protein